MMNRRIVPVSIIWIFHHRIIGGVPTLSHAMHAINTSAGGTVHAATGAAPECATNKAKPLANVIQ
jgi:hypothetical protein